MNRRLPEDARAALGWTDEPLDDTHAMCTDALTETRNQFTRAQLKAARWQPRPCPSKEES
jgi:alkylhydroperoxidase family enzyme